MKNNFKNKITNKELEALKTKYNAKNWGNKEFIEWYKRNIGVGYSIQIEQKTPIQLKFNI